MGNFFSAVGNFVNDAMNYTFSEIPRFFFKDVPHVLWAFPNLIRDLFNAIITCIQNLFQSVVTFIQAIVSFIGAIFALIGGFFKTLKAFVQIF